MLHMICTHRVRDYDAWYAVFREHADAQAESGLRIRRVMRDAEDPDRVVMWFEVDDPDRARAFMATPAAAEAGERSGVVGPAEVWFLSVESGP